MVIVALIFRRQVSYLFLIALGLVFLGVRSMADDQITKTDGTTISGQILSVADGQVMVQSLTSRGGVAKIPYSLSDVKSVVMATPADVTAAEAPGTDPAAVVAALEPVVKQFAGLPADWVVAAMGQLADAYSAEGKPDSALAVYNQIIQFYPGTAYENVAKAGKAQMSLKAGKIDEALAAVQPIVDKANQDIAPSPSDGALYAKAFLVYGQVLEKQAKPQQALEAYLTVKTMFYQNPALVDQADQLAKNLRDQNPGLGVD
jgi:tetratricopeptide (TPR) repeat protein